MDNKRAIENLETLRYLMDIPEIDSGEIIVTIDKAIKALRAQAGGDLISRQQTMSDYADWYGYDYQNNWFYKHLKSMPSVAIPNKVGHWKHGICDNCGYDWSKDAPIASVPKFCPNCGCPMVIER